MSGTYGAFKTSGKLEVEGIVIDYGPGGKFRIARSGGANKRYQTRLEELGRPYRRALATGTMPAERADDLLRQVFSETVMLGWEDVTDPDGKPLAFTVENCIKLFKDLPDLFEDLREQSQRQALFREQQREADAGNSPSA